MKIVLSVLSAFILVVLSGCAASGKSGPAIDIYPVTYSLAIQTDRHHIKDSKQEWSAFIESNKSKLLTQPVILAWTTSDGAKFARQAKKELIRLGVSSEYINEKEVESAAEQRFDFQVSVVEHRVVVPICEPIKVGTYHTGAGCYAESARWQSMVRPEKMSGSK
ncbi:hypothetical protein ACMUMQ_12245 [Marinomonas sp. 2405UD66-6]|uniref:hypothetical protein n=1 Tax=Marinomonas sp. 2405UD66-6 TaxID=3391834 RepID=UPI0039C959AF